MKDFKALCCVVGAILAIPALMLLGNYDGRHTVQKDAIKHGVAEYVITDPSTGATEFKWKEPKP